MSAYAAALAPANAPYVSLDRIPLVLILGAFVLGIFGKRLGPKRSVSAALVSIGMSIGLLLVHVAQLFTLEPSQRTLRDVAMNLVRVGSFDANAGFFVDLPAALLLLFTLGAIAFVSFRNELVQKNPPSSYYLISMLLLAAGASMTLLADGFVVLLFGLSFATVAIYLLVVRSERLSDPVTIANRLFSVQFAAIASVVAAFALLFWSLGGKWVDRDGYIADYRARFVAVHAPGRLPGPEEVVVPEDSLRVERDAAQVSERAKQRGSLTFTTHPGARVYVDAGTTALDRAEPFAVSPFVRKNIAAGVHELVIVPGGGAIVSGDGNEAAWIERLVVGVDEDISIIATGQSTTFVEIVDQLDVVDAEGKHVLRNALFAKTAGSFSVVSVVVFFLALAAFFFSMPLVAIAMFARATVSPARIISCVGAMAISVHLLACLYRLVSLHLDVVGAVFVIGAALVAILRARRSSLIVGAATIVASLVVCAPRVAHAADPAARIEVRAERGEVVELDYAPDGETMIGSFVIRSLGAAPLHVTHVGISGSAQDTRTPPFMSFEVEGTKTQPFQIDPGKERRVVVRWKYAAARAREVFGHMFVQSNGEGPARLPIHATRPRDLGLFGDYALSHIVWLPLGAALLALVLRLFRRDDPRWLALSSGLIYAGNLAFVLFVAYRFDAMFGRMDGNDGYQFIERRVLSSSFGPEYYLGIDGISLTLVIVTSIVALVVAFASDSLREKPVWFHVSASVLVTSVLGVLLSADLALFCVFWLVGVLAAISLVARCASRPVSLRFAAVSIAGAAFLITSAFWLHWHSSTAYDVLGRFGATAFALPDLMRSDWLRVQSSLFDVMSIKVVWSVLFVAFVSRLVTLTDVVVEGDGPTNALLPALWAGTGVYALLRFCVGILSPAAKWAATTTIATGVILLIVFALLASVEKDLKRFIARIFAAYAGLALVGIGSLTPQGLSAAMYVAVTLGFAVGLMSMLASAIEARAGTRDISQLVGLSTKMPRLATFFGIGALTAAGLPGLIGFWGLLLAMTGAFVREPFLAGLALVGVIVSAVAAARVAGKTLFGPSRSKSKKEKLADLSHRELVVVATLAIIVVGLGLAPKTLFSLLDVVILDLHRLVDAAGITQVG